MRLWPRRARKQADLAPPMEAPVDPMAQPMPAPADPADDILHHCPWCGSGNVTGGSDGTVECGFCDKVFKVFVQPTHPYMPQTVNGQPFEVPGSPQPSDQPVPAAGAPTPMPGAGAVPGAPGAAGGIEQFRVDAPAGGVPGGAPQGLERFRAVRMVTDSGVALPIDSYVAHLAIKHADDRAAVIAQVRGSRG